MCGITGYISFDGKTIKAEEYYSAHLTISHRGPDDEGFVRLDGNEVEALSGEDTSKELDYFPSIKDYQEFSGIIGHRRLSILDLSVAGHQPLSYESLHLVYNGEIYNYVELRQELEDLGYQFATLTDTEVFLKAYHCWGQSCFQRFNGMWAAAIYCAEKQELVLSRDRFGIKPLYYYIDGQSCYFASEVKYFRKLGLVTAVDQEQVCQYLRYTTTDHSESTFFKGISQIMPGSILTLSKKGKNMSQYWRLSQGNPMNEDEMGALIVDAIRLRMRSDVKVGALLSGGIDSSAIVGAISEHKFSGGNTLNTYSAVFEQEEFSEKQYIDKTLSRFNLDGHFVLPKVNSLIDELDALLYTQEFPIRSLGIYSQYKIYQFIQSQGDVKVLLNGQGADEVFSGYTSHFYAYLSTLLMKFQWYALFKEISSFSRHRSLPYKKVLLNWGKQLFSQRWGKFNKSGIFKVSYSRPSLPKYFTSPIKQALWENLSLSALREYLRYEDRNSMAFSVESRLPYLDYRLVCAAFSMPDKCYVDKGVTKQFLRKVVTPYLETSVLHRKDKMGFVSPQELWQRKELFPIMKDAFEDIRDNGLFDFLDSNMIYNQFDRYCKNDNGDWPFIWRLFCLYRWKKVWFEHA